MVQLVEDGGFGTGGFNFDAKLRRQSVDPADLYLAHIGGIDTIARALLIAERVIADGGLDRARAAAIAAGARASGAASSPARPISPDSRRTPKPRRNRNRRAAGRRRWKNSTTGSSDGRRESGGRLTRQSTPRPSPSRALQLPAVGTGKSSPNGFVCISACGKVMCHSRCGYLVKVRCGGTLGRGMPLGEPAHDRRQRKGKRPWACIKGTYRPDSNFRRD